MPWTLKRLQGRWNSHTCIIHVCFINVQLNKDLWSNDNGKYHDNAEDEMNIMHKEHLPLAGQIAVQSSPQFKLAGDLPRLTESQELPYLT